MATPAAKRRRTTLTAASSGRCWATEKQTRHGQAASIPRSGGAGRRQQPPLLLPGPLPSRVLRMRKNSFGACSLFYGPVLAYRPGSERGSPNHGMTLASKRVMPQIRSPARVST